MGIAAGDFLSFAEKLLSEETEINYRNAASRSYYAAFHYCLPITELLDKPSQDGGIHATVCKKLSESFDHKLKSIGYMLQQCRSIRVRADYGLDEDFSRSGGELAIKLAKKIIDRVLELEPKDKNTK